MQKEVHIAFLDTFYSLSSNDESERSIAASSLLHHVFFACHKESSTFNKENEEERFDTLLKDGNYALQRLVQGLYSGRASARQGYASCLASFLKLAFYSRPPQTHSDKVWIHCFMGQAPISNKLELSPNEYIREKLRGDAQYNDTSSDGKRMNKKGKKGSEERDYLFGKLFGILAVVRSGILRLDMSISQVSSALNILANYKATWIVLALNNCFSYLHPPDHKKLHL